MRATKGIGAVGLCLALCLGGCAASGERPTSDDAAAQSDGAATHEFVDDLGTTVSVADPQRVVAAMGSFARMWELAGGELVGASDDAFSNYAIESDGASSVGDFSDPSLEAIIALDPDFAIMTAGTGGRGGASSQEALRDALESSGIEAAYFNVSTFDDYARVMQEFCVITGRDDLYAQHVEEVRDRIEGVIAEADALLESGHASPRVLLATSYSGGIRVQDSSSMTGAMLKDLGATNIADENPSLLSDFSIEAAIEADPDCIVLIPMGDDAQAAERNLQSWILDNPAWESMQAVKAGNVTLLDAEGFLYKPNEKWDESYRTLFEVVYGSLGENA